MVDIDRRIVTFRSPFRGVDATRLALTSLLERNWSCIFVVGFIHGRAVIVLMLIVIGVCVRFGRV